MARPTKYKPEYAGQAYKLCLLGATDEEMAGFFNISIMSLYSWKRRFPVFIEALNDGKARADANVAQSLYRKAIGYSHTETELKVMEDGQEPVTVATTRHFPPDTTACIFWLKNRTARREQPWRDKHDHVVSGGVKIEKIERVIVDERPVVVPGVIEGAEPGELTYLDGTPLTH